MAFLQTKICFTVRKLVASVIGFNRLFYLLAFLPLCQSSDCIADPFPQYSKIEKGLIFPREGRISVSADGNFMLNGCERYLFGTIYYEGSISHINLPTSGYPASLQWLYETTLDYTGHQRLGFDVTGICAPNDWIQTFRPDYRKSYAFTSPERLKRILHSGLPVYLDYTCAPWSHGALSQKENMPPAGEAFHPENTSGSNHWMPYSIISKTGIGLYCEMWSYGARFMRDMGVKPFIYELFNEPEYNDAGTLARKAFVERMIKTYKSIESLNKAWNSSYPDFNAVGRFGKTTENPALYVEWSEFMEDCFANICKIGVDAIKKVDPRPEALFCFQPLSSNGKHTNIYKANHYFNAICTGTGGGNLLMAKEYMSLAKGKPILDGEAYMGKTARSVRNKFWLEYARGYDATFVFKWDRRPNDKHWKNRDAAGGKLTAQRFPYLLLNPYAVPTEALGGVMQAKKEIHAVSDIFTPRRNRAQAKIALLYSFATRRLSRALGHTAYKLYDSYGFALAYSAYPFDVVFEEQLSSDLHKKYRIIIAAGVDAVLPETPKYLEQFVKNGGTLILADQTLQHNRLGSQISENGFPGIVPGKELQAELSTLKYRNISVAAARSRSWENAGNWNVTGTISGSPSILENHLGNGKLIYITARMPQESLGEFLRELLSLYDIRPVAVLNDIKTGRMAGNIEIHKAAKNGETGYVLINHSLSPQVIRFRPDDEKLTYALPFSGYTLIPDGKTFVLCLPPEECIVLIGGSGSQQERRFGALKSLSYKDAERIARSKLKHYEAAKQTVGHEFNVDAENIRFIDIRSAANSHYEDKVAGDGQGGWTDQGENSLRYVPWGVEQCNGIPFDFIRHDMNSGHSCIVMGSKMRPDAPEKVRGIQVGSPVKNLYFLQAAAWTGEGLCFTYVIHYRDGSKIAVPVRDNIEIADWFKMKTKVPGLKAKVGWVNSEGRGLWIFKWTNPYPKKEIKSIDVISAWRKSFGLIGAISLELPDTSEKITLLKSTPENYTLISWGGTKVECNDKNIFLNIDEKSKKFCGTSIVMLKPENLEYKREKTFLTFELNGLPDQWGAYKGGQALQMKVQYNGKDNRLKSSNRIFLRDFGGSIGTIPDRWQKVKIPMTLLVSEDNQSIKKLTFQFYKLPPEPSGVRIRNIALQLEQ